MGIYLSQPCTHVELEAGVGPTTNFGVGTMQVRQRQLPWYGGSTLLAARLSSFGLQCRLILFRFEGVAKAHGGCAHRPH
jgi:hypothetical protein